MNNKFLNKVADRLVKETRIDYTKGSVRTPFLPRFTTPLFTILGAPPFFSEHCENIYGLNNEETDYVWKEYKDIIDNKIIKELV